MNNAFQTTGERFLVSLLEKKQQSTGGKGLFDRENNRNYCLDSKKRERKHNLHKEYYYTHGVNKCNHLCLCVAVCRSSFVKWVIVISHLRVNIAPKNQLIGRIRSLALTHIH